MIHNMFKLYRRKDNSMNDILKTDTLNQIFDKTKDNFDELEMMDRTIDSKIDSNKTEVNTSINELNSKIDTTNTRINNLVANTGNSNSEIVDARVDADGHTHSTLGDHIRNKESNIYSSLETLTSRTAIYFTSEDDGVYVHYVS